MTRLATTLARWDLLGFWRGPRRKIRRWALMRRGWPKPADLDDMSWEERDAYSGHIGLDARVATAVASLDARRAAETDTGVRGG